jgi:cysteine-rich repeat protein
MRLALALGLIATLGCKAETFGLAPDDVPLDDSGNPIVDSTMTTVEDTYVPDAIVSDTSPVFPTDDSSPIPECTGKPDGTVCGAATPRSVCIKGECLTSICGDSFVDKGGGEDCDDGNTDDGDNCPGDCKAKCKTNAECEDMNACTIITCDTAKFVCAAPKPAPKGTPCTPTGGGAGMCNGGLFCSAPNCGNKIVEAGEDCDDQNTNDSDGCRSDCTWTCTSDPDCGDDGDACNGKERCNLTTHTCSTSPPVDCRDGNACTDDSCNPSTGACTHTYRDSDGDGVKCGMGDCHDQNPLVKPGVMAWYTVPYTTPTGGSSFDYNCSGASERRYTTTGSCVKSGSDCTHTWGWKGGAPNCGTEADVVAGCDPAGCKEIIGKAKQECH